ncbi:hypothetical protein ATH50_3547 [Haloplanus aerogenes]|nr:hypothetical protein ATH50_3547 [Haloplanus aerogenes]
MLALTASATQATAHPPPSPEHGVNETTYCTLWAGDTDATNTSTLHARTANTTRGVCVVAAGTDIPLNAPPAAVEQWNRGDLHDFPITDSDQAIAPPTAPLSHGRFIKDAYTAIFAVQPSTRARLSPAAQPLYVASNGTLLGTVDSRVAVPPDDTTGSRRVYWSLVAHDIRETRVRVAGTMISNASGNHTPTLPYALQSSGSRSQELILEADITATLRKRVETCIARDVDGNCIKWENTITYPTETLTVQDQLEVVPYDLTISGYRAAYPNGDLGLVIYKNQPWLGYSLPNGDVHGVWRFYVARNEDWDTLVVRTESGETVQDSPLHPLQIAAYPIEPGPTASRRTVTILEAYGVTTTPPTLPPTVLLDILTDPYTSSYGLATRTKTTNHNLAAVTAYGIVRGVDVDAKPSDFAEIPINQSDLTVTVRQTTPETMTVRVQVQDAQTGAPINTAGREGYVVLADTRVNTSGNGTVTTTLPRTSGGIAARYEPGRWWTASPGYTGDSDVAYVHGTVLQALSVLYQLAIPVSLFLVGVFLIDRITGWRVWPPWRRV